MTLHNPFPALLKTPHIAYTPPYLAEYGECVITGVDHSPSPLKSEWLTDENKKTCDIQGEQGSHPIVSNIEKGI